MNHQKNDLLAKRSSTKAFDQISVGEKLHRPIEDRPNAHRPKEFSIKLLSANIFIGQMLSENIKSAKR